ncbi:L domain-like protein [Backusella circina FSU 941]|nr:L domain-like protein [Backusella circina FSU 941]
MGQAESVDHSPLTFGYASNTHSAEDDDVDDLDLKNSDFVLNNPQLYQLQAICQQCSPNLLKNGVTVSSTNESCSICKRRKRLSLVRKDLADDLDYIDQTYYPDLVHYNTNTPNSSSIDAIEDELLQIEEETKPEAEESHFSRLTIGDVSPNLKARRLTNPAVVVDLSNKSIIKLSPSIGYLQSLNKLELSNNEMTELPRELGYLKNLIMLNLSHNKLEDIPNTIAFLSKLKALNVSHNNLKSLPPALGEPSKLVIIIANNNQLESIPRELTKLRRLVSLNISNNPLTILPAEIASLPNLRKLLTVNCEFKEEYHYPLNHDPPSLVEFCARQVMSSRNSVPQDLAEHIKNYLSRAESCSYCKGYFFESYVTRIRFVERAAHQIIALEYKLCSAHWIDESDRLRLSFSEEIVSAISVRVNDVGITASTKKLPKKPRSYSDNRAQSPVQTRSERSLTDVESPTIPLYRLKSQPTLPRLQVDESSQSKSLPPSPSISNRQCTRSRSSSSSSITKRFTNFLNRSNTNLSEQDEPRTSAFLKVPAD